MNSLPIRLVPSCLLILAAGACFAQPKGAEAQQGELRASESQAPDAQAVDAQAEGADGQSSEARREDPIRFNRDVRPILSDRCYQCHGPADQESGMRLDSFEGATESVVVPGDWRASELMARVTSDDPDMRMPPPASKKEPLSAREIETLKTWISAGAEYEPHWSYAPLTKPKPPKVRGEAWVRNPIDRFVLARLEQRGLPPADEADKTTLVRRLYLDLTGLPPTPEQADEFLRNNKPNAYEELVDKLLASPRYAERIATWWFDLTRFASTVGFHGDQVHSILPYRDYVLKSFHENKPFDEFTLEQLAGDLLPPAGDELSDTWRQVATGYNRLPMSSHEGGIQDKEYRAKLLADRVRNVSEVWMGSSMGCCQCHDHKYDPFTIKDFYSMAAFFADVDHFGSFVGVGDNTNPTRRPPEMLAWSLPVAKQAAELDAKIAELEKKLVGRLPKDYGKIRTEITKLSVQRAKLNDKLQPTMVTIATKPPAVRVLDRGNWMDDTGEIVSPHLPEFLVEPPAGDKRLTRLDLANWLVSDDNPLTSRVVANRLWRLYFGTGISQVMIDFGSQGEAPTHPDLLDWLATDLRENNWDIKRFVRQIVTTSAYRQSSLPRDDMRNEEGVDSDPDNRLLARQGRYRMEAEQIRDTALQAAGLLVNQLGGDFAKPYQPAGYYAQLNFPKRGYKASQGEAQYRRGVYTHWQRQYLHPWLLAFDAPSREECTASRNHSNTPGSALVLLNDPSFVEAARNVAARILTEGPKPSDGEEHVDGDRIRWAWRLITSRQPRSDEVQPLLTLLAKQRDLYAADTKAAEELTSIGDSPRPKEIAAHELAAWTAISRVLINLNETITRN